MVVKNLPANAGDIRDTGSIPVWGGSLQEGMATHSSILAWRIPWTDGAWRTTVYRSQSQTRLKQLRRMHQNNGSLQFLLFHSFFKNRAKNKTESCISPKAIRLSSWEFAFLSN